MEEEKLQIKKSQLQNDLNSLNYDLENIICSYEELLILLEECLVSDKKIYELEIKDCIYELYNVINDVII